jgi:hypothetical protein
MVLNQAKMESQKSTLLMLSRGKKSMFLKCPNPKEMRFLKADESKMIKQDSRGEGKGVRHEKGNLNRLAGAEHVGGFQTCVSSNTGFEYGTDQNACLW